jgi:enoyl-CoA hydratase/carnithine racemase
MDIALYCDIRIASDRAKFGWFFVRRGVVGTIGGTFILRQLVGLSKAFELTLTGDLIDADEALRIGLVSKVVAQDALLDEAHALARKLASGPPLAQQAVKRAMHKGFQMEWQSLGEYQQALGDVLWETDDHMEGVHSFTEKREPRFTGK